MDLSVLIPARNEQWLARTVADVLEHARGDTEVIVVLDGAWADPPLPQHPRLQVVYLPDYSNGGDLIIARRGIDSLEALAGKRVAIEPGTMNGYILARALAHRGVNLQAVRQVGMPQAEMHRALTHGEIDAAVTYAPFSVDMLKNPQLQPLFTTREIPGEVLDVLAIDASVVTLTRRARTIRSPRTCSTASAMGAAALPAPTKNMR